MLVIRIVGLVHDFDTNDGRVMMATMINDGRSEMAVVTIAVASAMIYFCKRVRIDHAGMQICSVQIVTSTYTTGTGKLRILCPVLTQLFLGLSKPSLVSRVHNEGNSVAVTEIFLPNFS